MKLLFKNIFRSFQAYIKIKCQKRWEILICDRKVLNYVIFSE